MALSASPWNELSRNPYSSMTVLRRRPGLPIFLVVLAVFILSFLGYSSRSYYQEQPQRVLHPASKGDFQSAWNYTRDAKNFKLTDAQCTAAFPDLFYEIDRAKVLREKNHVTLKEIDEVPKVQGYVRAMIFDQELFVLGDANGVNSRHLATLHALHRAILTSPEPLPNTEFTFNVNDIGPETTTWTYARREEHTSSWLMPDFGYWSWPEPKIGAYNEVQQKAIELEAETPWTKKITKLIWRGAILDRKVREDLLKMSEGKDWSDVRRLDWSADAKGETHDRITMDEHCRYKFVAHTEGVSYSARLQNLQNCRSVIVAHKMEWIQHHSHLMSPAGPNQNYVEVKLDWSDLPERMDWLLGMDRQKNERPELERIADNNVKVFREHYLTPAAETCYWRRLIRAWAEVSPEPEFYTKVDGKKVWRGLPVESYLLERRMEWDFH